MVKTWWKEAVIYQIYPRSFMDSNGDGIGDLKGITSRLDYLKYLGVDVIWLSPVYQSPNDDNGYDISDYQAIMPEFGTMEDFDRMLSEAHKRGIKIVMDLVVNHTSDEHSWFVESRSSVDNPYRDYYIWKPGKKGEDGRETAPNNWGSFFSGPAWEYDEKTQMYFLHLFSKKQPDLNWENDKVRNEVFSMMDWWLKKGIDGFRMDVISLISKNQDFPDAPVKENSIYGDAGRYTANGPRVHEFLKEMNQKVLSKYDIMTVGEASGVTVEEAKKYASLDNSELNMVFQFEHMDLDGGETFKWNDKKIDLVELKKTLSKWQYELEGKAWNSLYWNNHDQPRIVSRLGDDTVYRERSAKMLGTCIHMMQGTPYIYQGEELGMTNAPFGGIEDFRDIESINAFRELTQNGMEAETILKYIRYKSRDNARTPFQWEDGPFAGFTTGTPWIMVNPNYKEINAKKALENPESVFYYYQKLIKLRKEKPVIVYGRYELLMEDHKALYAYTREYEGEKLLTVCNFTKESVEFELPEEFIKGTVLLSNVNRQKTEPSFALEPYEALVVIL